MKISDIFSRDVSRREFLKKTSGGILAALTRGWVNVVKTAVENPSELQKYIDSYNHLSSAQKEAVKFFTDNIIGMEFKNGKWIEPVSGEQVMSPSDMMETMVSDGKIDLSYFFPKATAQQEENIPLHNVYGFLAKKAIEGDSIKELLSGTSPNNINSIFPGFLDLIINKAIEKFGIENVVNGVSHDLNSFGKHNEYIKLMQNIKSPHWGAIEAIASNRSIQQRYRINPDMVRQAQQTGRYLSSLVDKGFLSKEVAANHMHGLRHQMMLDRINNKDIEDKAAREETKKREQERREQERREQENTDDKKNMLSQEYHGSMHQMYESFKSKLNMILEREQFITPQMQDTIDRLSDHHGYTAIFIKNLGNGVSLYDVGGIYYKIRGDGTIL
jgi:hypothetical protein